MWVADALVLAACGLVCEDERVGLARATMVPEDFLPRVRTALEQAFGQRLVQVVLYGSEARGEAGADSDIDLLVVLRGPADFGTDLRSCIHVLYPLVLELERPIHATPVDEEVYKAQEFSLYRHAKREGVLA